METGICVDYLENCFERDTYHTRKSVGKRESGLNDRASIEFGIAEGYRFARMEFIRILVDKDKNLAYNVFTELMNRAVADLISCKASEVYCLNHIISDMKFELEKLK